MKILFIANGITSFHGLVNVSGADVRWIEIAKKCKENGNKVHVLTTESGLDLCQKLGLGATYHLFRSPSEYRYWTFVFRGIASKYVIPKSLRNFDGDLIYSTSSDCFDVLPAIYLRKRSQNSRWVVVVHWVSSLHRHGFILDNVLYFLQQKISLNKVKKYADAILAVSQSTAESLKKNGFEDRKIYVVQCGVDRKRMHQISSSVKIKNFDACFMKRFHQAKGVFDLIKIWKIVVQKKTDARLLLIGDGTTKVNRKLEKMIKEENLTSNVIFAGTVYDYLKKYRLLAQSRLFVLPSYEENWGIVIGEAMATKLPVICYDIKEIRPIWRDNVVWIPKGDRKGFAKAIINLLRNNSATNEISKKAFRFVKKYSWDSVARRELEILRNYSPN